MVEFVVNLWNKFSAADDFENEIPLLANGRRMARLGMRNRLQVCFLAGIDQLPNRYLDEARELGFTFHDVSRLAAQCERSAPLLVEKYANWGNIKHRGLLRFLTMKEQFSGSSIITFDGDMILNASFDEMEMVLGDVFCFLNNSSCFGSLPARSGFLDIFEDHLGQLLRHPDTYAKEVMRLPSADAFFDPHKAGGSDQAFILHLFRQGIVPFHDAHEICRKSNILAFPNWLLLDEVGEKGLNYSRRDGVDYLGEMKVLISHLSHDTCAYFGQFLFMERVLGVEGIDKFGRIPLIFDHYSRTAECDPEIVPFFRRLFFLMTQRYPAIKKLPTNPFWRSQVVEQFYEKSDLSQILNDRVWHTPGVFGRSA